jgi:large-conductance mechanosensitive channel
METLTRRFSYFDLRGILLGCVGGHIIVWVSTSVVTSLVPWLKNPLIVFGLILKIVNISHLKSIMS